MRSLEYVEPRTLRWVDAPEPRLESDADAIVRPVAATTCDLDRALIAGRTPFEGSFAIGHECVAEVVEIGDGKGGLEPGQLVIVPWNVFCGECRRCLEGLTAHCLEAPRYAMYGLPVGGDFGGFFSDLVRVPWGARTLVPLPPGVSPRAVASASDNLTDAWLRVGPLLRDSPGSEVLVVGGTPSIGLYAAAFAVAMGAGRVDYVDPDPARRALAQGFGAEVLEEPPERSDRREYRITVDASARPDGLVAALRAAAPGGTCTSVGIYFGETPLPLGDMYMGGVSLETGRPNVGLAIPAVLELVAEGAVDPTPVFSGEVPWDDAADALAELPRKPLVVREDVAG